jgi:hypothetical protein
VKTQKALKFSGARESGMGQHKAKRIVQEQLREAKMRQEKQGWEKTGGMWEETHHPWSKVWADNAESADLAMELAEALPHGSGIDYAWAIEQSGDMRFSCTNSYHGMDEFGGYVMPVEFTAEVVVEDGQFVVQDITVLAPSFDDWEDDPETYPACWEGLDDYLFETIHWAFNRPQQN